MHHEIRIGRTDRFFRGLSTCQINSEEMVPGMITNACEVTGVTDFVKIEDLYLEKGFFLAEVSTKVERGSGNEVVIRFNITENKKVLVKKINLVGNKELSDLFIKQRLQTKGAGILPGLGETGTYRRETLETDAEIIAYLYSTVGYVDVQVSEPEVVLTPDKRWVYVTIHIDEGEQYRVGTISFHFGSSLVTPVLCCCRYRYRRGMRMLARGIATM